MIQAVLFDFNGVVIDDERIQMKAYQEVFSGKGIELTEEDYFDCLGMSDPVFVKTIFEKSGRAASSDEIAAATAEKTKKWKEAVDAGIPLFEGIEDFIKRLQTEFTLGLVSMACRKEIDHILKSTGLDVCFETIVSSEDVPTTKPDPACYREGFRRVDLAGVAKGNSPITRRQCVVIEDSPAGVISAKSARLKALGVTNTVDAGALRDAGADAVTANVNDWNAESFRRVF
ncbi:MAG: HAD family phosphatase [Acidobacteriota bacterium]|nr:HAD family phosphatase [Acidobacteriota bacterium]MDH3530150.1 HAD family phosphatase [Acidobacteriota bacterium]